MKTQSIWIKGFDYDKVNTQKNTLVIYPSKNSCQRFNILPPTTQKMQKRKEKGKACFGSDVQVRDWFRLRPGKELLTV